MKAIFGFEQISLGVHDKDREWFADYAEHATTASTICATCRTRTPWARRRPSSSTPPTPGCPGSWTRPTARGARDAADVGKVVNNSETLLNVYNALFLGKPLTTKFFSVYGEEMDIRSTKCR
jgi:Na+-translocating ferredoxin:NAD+ oxidoreductase RnfC subunit